MRPIPVLIAVLLGIAASWQPPLGAEEAVPVRAAKGALLVKMEETRRRDWLSRWQKTILADARNRYCDKEMGEEIGWLMAPFLEGFHQGWLATGETKWIDALVDWTDAWIRRGVTEPDGCLGWPKSGAAGTKVDGLDDFNADSLLGEAMVLRPIVLLSAEIERTAALKEKYGAKAGGYLRLAEATYAKWDQRSAWRETGDGGIITVVHAYGIGADGRWTDGYARRNGPASGFSHPCNKANATARWLLALYDATRKPVYRERAARWFQLMKARITPRDDGTVAIWNYWEPAGAWDRRPDGQPKHWVGVHPKGGYYAIDMEAVVDAYEHAVVFTAEDIRRFVSTAVAGKRSWPALAPYSAALQREFESGHQPDGWSGLASTPWYLALQRQLAP